MLTTAFQLRFWMGRGD